MENKFKYKGFTFQPLGRINKNMSFMQMSKRVSSDRDLGLSRYWWAKHKWDYDAFYKASGDSSADLFICVENGNVYIPAQNELFLYN